ncbi:MAG: FecR domain-containing protein [Sandaracinus sp.]
MSGELEKARTAEPAWDEVRERRVLARVLAARDESERRRARRQRVAVSFAAAAAIVVAAFVARTRPWASEAPASPAPALAVAPAGGRLALHDGSIVELTHGAQVSVVTDAATEVRIDHAAGEARYVVSHRPARAFVVACGTVEVIVRGTRFVVRREGARVDVDVEDGRVEVRRGGESTMLVRGESLRIDGAAHAEAPPATATPSDAESAAATEGAPAVGETPPSSESAETTAATSARTGSARPSATSHAPPPSIDALLAEAGIARRERRWEDAARALHAAIDASAGDPRAATYEFMLARVERSRGHESDAADAFAAAYRRDPDAVLAEDALAESVVSLAASGRASEARAAATLYAQRFPGGAYAERVQGALAPAP